MRQPQAKTAKKFVKKKQSDQISMYKNIKNNVRLVRRNTDVGTITCAMTTTTFGALTFRLVNLPNSGEFTSLYDQYKINAVNVQFFPQQTEVTRVNFPGETACAYARVITAIDYSDSTPPAQMDDLREYENCEVRSIVTPFSVYIDKPKYVDNTGALRTGYIATTSPSTIHYGLKYGIDIPNPGSAGTYLFRIEATYYMSFKAIK